MRRASHTHLTARSPTSCPCRMCFFRKTSRRWQTPAPPVPLSAARSEAHGRGLEGSCWLLARSQGAPPRQDAFCCLAGTFVSLVFILVLIPSFSDILINLSPHQGFDLLICFYTFQISADPHQTSCSQLVSLTSAGMFCRLVCQQSARMSAPSHTPVLAPRAQ